MTEAQEQRDTGTRLVEAASLRALICRLFTAAGAPPEDAETVAEVLVEADLRGVESHGSTRVAGYLMTIDPAAFMPLDQFAVRVDRLVRHIKSSETAVGVQEVYVAGEIEFRKKEERLSDGIPVSPVVWRELEELAAAQHVPFEWVSDLG